MSEELLSNIDIDLGDVSVTRPLLDKVTGRCRCGTPKVERTDKGLRRFTMPLILEEPLKDTTGKDVNVGFQVTHSFLLDESGGWTKQRAAEEFLRTKMACLGVDEATAKALPNDATQFEGKFVLATFKVAKDGTSQNVARIAAVK